MLPSLWPRPWHRRHDTMWVRLASGGTEIICGVQTRGPAQRTTLLLDRLAGSRRVVGISAHLLLHLFSPLVWSWLSEALSSDEVAALAPQAPKGPTGGATGELQWTAADERLVGLLQADGRASAARLAQATGWHESTVRRRIDQLTTSGTLQFDPRLGRRGDRHRGGRPAVAGRRSRGPGGHRPADRSASRGAVRGCLHRPSEPPHRRGLSRLRPTCTATSPRSWARFQPSAPSNPFRSSAPTNARPAVRPVLSPVV